METQHAAPLEAAGENISKFKKKQIEYFLKIAAEVARLKDSLGYESQAMIASWLRQDMGFSDVEANLLEKCPPDVLTKKIVLEKSDVSIGAVHAIVSSDPATRAECFVRLARAEHLDEASVVAIRNAKTSQAHSPEEIEHQQRSEAFEKASVEFGSTAIARFEREATELLSLLEAGVEFAGVPTAIAPELEEHERRIRQGAAALLTSFEDLFGSNHPPRYTAKANSASLSWLRPNDVAARGTAATSLSFSWYALRDLVDGASATEGSSDGEENGWKSPRKCLEFLAGRRSSAISHASAAGVAPTLKDSPTFVDIDAGFGGTALGLQAAGFRAAGVWVRDAAARAAMRENRPSWRVRKRVDDDLEAELVELSETKDVDLLTSGLPWRHYPDKTYVAESKAKATAKVVAAVKILNPKVFVFEAPSEAFDKQIARKLEGLGYDVNWHAIDVSSFGIAQAKSRSVVVGARDGYLDNFSMPLVEPPVRRTLAAAMADLVAGRDRGGGSVEADQNCSQEVMDWIRLCTDKFPLAPELAAPNKTKRRTEWRLRGIDISEYADPPHQLGAMRSKAGFRLTGSMLARIQGFPDRWIIDGTKASCPQIADAFPPMASKMLGLAIMSALTGAKFDQQLAAKSAILHVRRINVFRGDAPEWRVRPPSWLLSDPQFAFRKSAGRESLVRRRARHVADNSPPTAPAGIPPNETSDT